MQNYFIFLFSAQIGTLQMAGWWSSTIGQIPLLVATLRSTTPGTDIEHHSSDSHSREHEDGLGAPLYQWWGSPLVASACIAVCLTRVRLSVPSSNFSTSPLAVNSESSPLLFHPFSLLHINVFYHGFRNPSPHPRTRNSYLHRSRWNLH